MPPPAPPLPPGMPGSSTTSATVAPAVPYPMAFHFAVTIDSARVREPEASFQEVGGLSVEMEVETVTEGGRNESVHQLPKPVKYPRLTLKRGIAGRDSVLVQWCKSVLEGALAQPITTKPLQVRLLDQKGQPLRIWSFQDAFPVKWDVDPLDSTSNKVAMERIELVHRGWKRTL